MQTIFLPELSALDFCQLSIRLIFELIQLLVEEISKPVDVFQFVLRAHELVATEAHADELHEVEDGGDLREVAQMLVQKNVLRERDLLLSFKTYKNNKCLTIFLKACTCTTYMYAIFMNYMIVSNSHLIAIQYVKLY